MLRLMVVAILAFPITAVADEIVTKPTHLEGIDFAFAVSRTPQGEDYGYFLPGARWPIAGDGTTVVYVCWENFKDAWAAEHKLVQEAVEATWQDQSRLSLRGWLPCAERSSGIRIFVADDGPHTKGLGRDLDGKPQGMVLNFSFNLWGEPCKSTEQERLSCIKSIAVHEFGHAIGFAHEHNRPDRPGECRRPPQGTSEGAVALTPYDKKSVMNYCNPEYNNLGRLSELDIVALQKIYLAH